MSLYKQVSSDSGFYSSHLTSDSIQQHTSFLVPKKQQANTKLTSTSHCTTSSLIRESRQFGSNIPKRKSSISTRF
uniref:Uncharacterized protein n=1 Tax=Rhizophora mucronata TaxID=61149 RepID=A0A2P2N6F9_RHIMU